MGSTGEGIQHADKIDMSLNTSLTSAWSRVKEEFPWFFQMQELEAERLNRVPTGLGNSQTEIDIDLISRASSDGDGLADQPVDIDETHSNSPDWDLNEMEKDLKKADKTSEASEDEDTKPITTHSKKPAKKTAAKPVISSPAVKREASKPSTKKSHKSVDRFTELVVKEEETAQQALDLEKTHTLAQFRKREHRDKVKENLKIRAMELRSQEWLACMEMEHKLRMREMELQLGSGNSQGLGNHIPFGSSSFQASSTLWDGSGASTWSSSSSGPASLLDEVNEAAHNFGLSLDDAGTSQPCEVAPGLTTSF